MKRLLFLMLLCSPLLFTSCIEENNYGSVDTYYLTVQPNHWEGSGIYGREGYLLEAAYDASYITSDVMEHGAVIVYYIDPEYGDIQLPYVFSRVVSGVASMDILRYEIYNGGISIIIDNLDFKADPYSIPIEFKIVVIR